jgi:hypothetical protein
VIYDLLNIAYTGYDIYKEIIEYNIDAQTKPKYKFIHSDFYENRNDIISCDLCIIKDVLTHWKSEAIYKFMDFLISSRKFKFILLVNCYNQIKAEGLLSKLRLATHYAMLYSAPCTAGELQIYIDKNEIKVKHAWKLLSQLRDLGVVYEKTERKCNVTGRLVIEWDLTDNLPIKSTTTSNTKKQRVSDTLEGLRLLYKIKNTSTYDDWKKVAILIKSI